MQIKYSGNDYSKTQLENFYIANNDRYFQEIDLKIELKNIIFSLFNNMKRNLDIPCPRTK